MIARISRQARSPNANSGSSESVVSAARRQQLIEQAAYLRAEQRGFFPGHELDDWYAAEGEIDLKLRGGRLPVPPEA